MQILILANARYKGGMSGSDAIYESFVKYWPEKIYVQQMMDIDYKPFFLCYLHRIFLACFIAMFEPRKYDMVYSASDFWMDCLPAFIHKLRGKKWVAGYYLQAFGDKLVYKWSQILSCFLVRKFADMVIVTNQTMNYLFEDKDKTWINGGVELSLAGTSNQEKIYDAVFCGRIHPSKGIDELIAIWKAVKLNEPKATLAIIGDGDLRVDYIKKRLQVDGVTYLGYMGDERYEVYKKSKCVLYPVPEKYDHFSMAPVEAMACGCVLICFNTPVINAIRPACLAANDLREFVIDVLTVIGHGYKKDDLPEHLKYENLSFQAWEWAQKYDYRTQSLRVYNDVMGVLNEDSNHRSAGDGRDCAVPGVKTA